MELAFETRNTAHLCPVVERTATQEEGTEVIVPDSYPDAGSVLFTTAAATLRSRECRAGSVLVSGAIRACALYRPEDGTEPRALEASIPFSLRMDHPAVTEDLQARVCCRVRQAEARVLNSRKLLFRVSVLCRLTGYAQQNEALCILKNPPEVLQTRDRTYPLGLTLAAAEKSFVAADELDLGSAAGEIQRICACEAVPTVTDRTIVGSRAVFKGDVRVKLLYQTADKTFACAQGKLPFSQYCDLDGDYDEKSLDVCLCVTGAEAEPDGASGKVLASVSMTAQCLVQGVQEVTVTEDAYTTRGTLTPQWQTHTFCCILDETTLSLPLRTQLEAEASRVLCCQVFVDLPQQRRLESGAELMVTVPVSLRVLYADRDGILQTAGEKLELSTQTALAENAVCTASVTLAEPTASAGPMGIEVRGTAELKLTFTSEQTLRTLCGGTLDLDAPENARRPSVILRANRAVTPVWDLAKAYATTVDAIVQANHLTGDEVEAGQMVLIPM